MQLFQDNDGSGGKLLLQLNKPRRNFVQVYPLESPCGFLTTKPVKIRNQLHLISASWKSLQCTPRRWGMGSTAASFLPKAAVGSCTTLQGGVGNATSTYRLCLILHPATWTTLCNVVCTAKSSLVAPGGRMGFACVAENGLHCSPAGSIFGYRPVFS